MSLEGPLEKEMATHSSILAWEIPRQKSPASCSPPGRRGVEHDRAHISHPVLMWSTPIIASGVQHPFMCFSAMYPFQWNGCSCLIAHFLIELFDFFLLLCFESLLTIIHSSPLSDVWFANILPWPIACLWVSFADKYLKLRGSSICQFSSYGSCFGVKSVNTAWA